MGKALFGRSFSDVGSTSSDFLIKTRGQVKIQMGNKFIDLIKDGKINATSKFIYEGKEVGTSDGIYVIKNGEDVKVSLVVSGQEIDLLGDSGTTFVSFLEGQVTTSEAKQNALTNIGFLYDNLSDLNENSLKNGIIYITSEQKLYIIKDGIATEFKLEIPNPYPKQFVIQKSDDSTGALVIKGEGKENSLAFDSLNIYQKENQSYIDSSEALHILINNSEILSADSNTAKFFTNVQSEQFQSENASSTYGFRLYESGDSYLEVDRAIIRKSISYPTAEDSYDNVEPIKENLWNSVYNIIAEFKDYDKSDWINEDTNEDSDEDISSDEQNNSEEDTEFYEIHCLYEHKFKVNDSLYAYVQVNDYPELDSDQDSDSAQEEETSLVNRTELIAFKVEEILNEFCIKVSIQPEFMSADYQELTSIVFTNILSQKVYLVGSEQSIDLLKIKNQNLDFLKSTSFKDEKDISKVTTRIGNIKELNLSGTDNGQKIPVKERGVYSDNACFLKAQYISDYNLPTNDNSSKFASTEWVNNLIPKGSIIMYNGLASTIPNGWHICDGTNGTPNLIGQFIKASDICGETGGDSEIQILEENMPKHTHTFVGGQVTTSENGSHTHTIRGKYGKSDNANDRDCLVTGLETDLITTSQTGAHTHTIDMSNTQLSYQGGGKPIKYQPKFYSLIYIMKMY